MCGGERVCELGHDAHGSCGIEWAVVREQRLEVRAVDEAHGQVELPVRLAGLVDRDDVRVLDARGAACFAQEAIAVRGIAASAPARSP